MNSTSGQKANGKGQSHSSNGKTLIKPRCYTFSLKLLKFIDDLPQGRSYWIISDQLLRSGTSIGANVTEASASSSKLEFKKFYEIALKSANETIYWLGLLKDSGKVEALKVDPLITETQELSRMLAKSVMTLKGKTSF